MEEEKEKEREKDSDEIIPSHVTWLAHVTNHRQKRSDKTCLMTLFGFIELVNSSTTAMILMLSVHEVQLYQWHGCFLNIRDPHRSTNI